MIVLGIETSCDDTACAIVKDGWQVLSNVSSSQNEIHEKFGGIVPELASRRHVNIIDLLSKEAVDKAGLSLDDIDAVAVTYGPGLSGSLVVGVSFAGALGFSLDVPVVRVNHLEGHIISSFLNLGPVEEDFIAMIVSGGHSNIYYCNGIGNYELLGRTVDDAAGEALDKAAKMMGLGYPGGPVIDRLASSGDAKKIKFPRPMMNRKDTYNFSFSGLKTALYTFLMDDKSQEYSDEDICASYQQAVVDCLIARCKRALKDKNISTLVIGGGVSANSRLREELELLKNKGINVLRPDLAYCADNGAMIAAVGYCMLKDGRADETSQKPIAPEPAARL